MASASNGFPFSRLIWIDSSRSGNRDTDAGRDRQRSGGSFFFNLRSGSSGYLLCVLGTHRWRQNRRGARTSHAPLTRTRHYAGNSLQITFPLLIFVLFNLKKWNYYTIQFWWLTGSTGQGRHLRVGGGQWRPARRQLQLWRLRVIHLHAIHRECFRTGRLPLVRRALRLHHGRHLLQRRLQRSENRNHHNRYLVALPVARWHHTHTHTHTHSPILTRHITTIIIIITIFLFWWFKFVDLWNDSGHLNWKIKCWNRPLSIWTTSAPWITRELRQRRRWRPELLRWRWRPSKESTHYFSSPISKRNSRALLRYRQEIAPINIVWW